MHSSNYTFHALVFQEPGKFGITPGKILTSAWDYEAIDSLFPTQTVKDKNGVHLWAAVALKPGTTRGSKAVDKVFAIVLDKDSADVGELDALTLHLDRAGYAYAVQSSFSHMNPDKKYLDGTPGPFDSFRVILPVTRAMTFEEYPAVVRAVLKHVVLPDPARYAEQVKGKTTKNAAGHETPIKPRGWDPACLKPAQAWYMPCSPPETAEQVVFALGEGDCVDVDTMLAFGYERGKRPQLHETGETSPACRVLMEQFMDAFARVGCDFDGNRAVCPACQYTVSPSLTADAGAEQILFTPWCGCEKADVLKAVGLTWADLSTDAYKTERDAKEDTQAQHTERVFQEVFDATAPRAPSGRIKPRLNAKPLQQNPILDELVKELAHDPETYCDNTNNLARLIHVKGEDKEPVIIAIADPGWLCPKLSDIADWFVTMGEEANKGCAAPMDLTQMLLSRRSYPGVRDIRGVVMSPFFRADGTLCMDEGYDAKSGMWLSLSGLKLPPIPEHPTRDDAREAVAMLKDLLRDFMFEDPGMTSIWLSLVLTPLARPRHSPVHLADAANPGTGKGLFCESAMQIAIGRKMTKPWPADETERGKMLVSSAVKGSPVFWLDNISPDLMLEGGAFEGAVTDGSTGRVLGASVDSPPIIRTTFIANGNNVRMSPDVMRRTLRCVVIADVANPAARPVTSFYYQNLNEHVIANRPRYMAAALTVLRAYYAAGKPPQATQSISFPEWSRDVASAIVWAGEPDPAQFLASLSQEADEKTEALTTILGFIEGLCNQGDGTMRAGQLCTLQAHENPVHEAVLEAMSILGVNKTPIESAQVGRLLTKIRGTVVRLKDGRDVRLLKSEGASHNKSYWVGPPPKRNKPSKL